MKCPIPAVGTARLQQELAHPGGDRGATDLDDETTSKTLDELTRHGVLVRASSAHGEGYELARRDWSNASDPASG